MPRFRSDDPWRVLWRVMTSDLLLGGVLLVLAQALLLAVWLPQTSTGEPTQDVVWQVQVERRFGDAAWFDTLRSPLRAIGAFNVADAVWFRLLLASLALFLLARLVDSVEGLWQGWRGVAAPEGASWGAVDGNWDDLVGSLRRRRLRVKVESGEGQAGAVLCADRWPWGELGPFLVHLGGLVVLLGATFTVLWGWRVGPLRLTVGESASVGRETGLTLQLEDLAEDRRRATGKIWCEKDTLVAAGDLTPGRPLTGRGVGAYLEGSGTALQVRATRGNAQELALDIGRERENQRELVLLFSDEEPSQVVGVPEANLALLLTMSGSISDTFASDRKDAALQVQVFESHTGQFIVEREVTADTVLEVNGVSVFLVPIAFAEIQVVHDPGSFWVQLGVALLIVGAILWRLWPSRRLWVRRRMGSGLEATGEMRLLPTFEAAPPQSAGDEA